MAQSGPDRMDASQWKMEFHVPLGLEERDRIFSTLTDVHDTPDRSAFLVSYHGEVLDFEERNE